MTFLDSHAPMRRIGPAVLGGIFLFLAGSFSVAGISLFGVHAGFAFFPLLVIAVWPRQANTLVSIAFVFSAGVFTDWATGGIVGQWALIFTVIWGVLRPELRSAPYAFFSLFVFWLATCGLAIVLLGLSGWFVYGVAPDFAAIGLQVCVATTALPAVALLRSIVAKRLFDGDEWGR